MGAATDAMLWSFSGVGFASSGVYLVVTLIEIRAAGGVRRFVRHEVHRIEEATEHEMEVIEREA
jgi:hypothetical protein